MSRSPGPRNADLRLLVYAMPSSGASLFTYFLAQTANSLAIIDYYNAAPVPVFDQQLPVIVKATVRTSVSFADHCASFKPSTTILYLRNPIDIHASLIQKHYANGGGSVEAKLAILEESFVDRDARFDLTLLYEDFVTNPWAVIEQLRNKSIAIPDDALSFRRGREEILDFNCRASTWCQQNLWSAWGSGNIHLDKLQSLPEIKMPREPESVEVAAASCPNLSAFYRQR